MPTTSLPSLPPPPPPPAAAAAEEEEEEEEEEKEEKEKDEKEESGYCVPANSVDNTLYLNLEKHGALNKQPDDSGSCARNIYESVDDVQCFYAVESED